MKCSLCNQPTFDSMVIETGNNAEIAIEVELCEGHYGEQESTGYAFEQKYSEQFLEIAAEKSY